MGAFATLIQRSSALSRAAIGYAQQTDRHTVFAAWLGTGWIMSGIGALVASLFLPEVAHFPGAIGGLAACLAVATSPVFALCASTHARARKRRMFKRPDFVNWHQLLRDAYAEEIALIEQTGMSAKDASRAKLDAYTRHIKKVDNLEREHRINPEFLHQMTSSPRLQSRSQRGEIRPFRENGSGATLHSGEQVSVFRLRDGAAMILADSPGAGCIEEGKTYIGVVAATESGGFVHLWDERGNRLPRLPLSLVEPVRVITD